MDLNAGLPGNNGRIAVVEAPWIGRCRNNGGSAIVGAPRVGFVQKQSRSAIVGAPWWEAEWKKET